MLVALWAHMAEKSQITVSRLLSFKVAATSRPQLTTGLTAERTGVGVYCLNIDFHRGTGPGNFLFQKRKARAFVQVTKGPSTSPERGNNRKTKTTIRKKDSNFFQVAASLHSKSAWYRPQQPPHLLLKGSCDNHTSYRFSLVSCDPFSIIHLTAWRVCLLIYSAARIEPQEPAFAAPVRLSLVSLVFFLVYFWILFFFFFYFFIFFLLLLFFIYLLFFSFFSFIFFSVLL